MRRIILLPLLLLFSFAGLTQVNLSSGLVAYYPFNGNFMDASGNGNNGVAMNGTAFGTDQAGNPLSAASFDGIDDWINVANPSFTFGHKFSFAYRFKTNSASPHQVLMSKADYSNAKNFNFQIGFNWAGVGGGLFLCTNHSNNTCTVAPNGTYTDYGLVANPTAANQWYCVVMTFNDGVKKIFVNGILVSQHTVTVGTNTTATDSCAGSAFRMGTWWQGDPYYFNGLMDEVRLYNRVLNPQEIDSVCNLTPQPASKMINAYAAVTSKPVSCDNTFSVDTATGFSAGDTVLMIQMKGATIDSSNTVSFGNVTALNGAGNYEYNVIKSVSGNNITLKYKVKRQYDIPTGKVQFVRVPNYQNYTVSTPHTALAWTGTKGGVLAMGVTGILTLNGSINVAEKGFRGAVNNIYTSGNQICSVPDYYLPPNNDSAGLKGEGISQVSPAKMYGRGKLTNGGGGGNAHNGGGGGGGNAGTGGIGGNELDVSCNPASNIYGGVGGLAMTYSNTANKIFLGGGGGSTQANNGSDASGGNGGGIVIISAGTIIGNGNQISAGGGDAKGCINTGVYGICHDGMGGGGAAGTVLIKSGTINSSISVIANGGKGGDESGNLQFGQVGPGGGGGGGAVWVSQAALPANITTSLNGGANGIISQSGSAYGAQPGNTGAAITGLQLLFPAIIDTFKVNTITVAFTDSIVSCLTRKFLDATTTTTTGASSYTWDFGGGNTSNVRNPTFTFAGNGTYPIKLVVVDSNGCKDSLTKNIIIATPRFIHAGNDTTTCLGVPVTLQANGAVTYNWQPDPTLSGSLNAATVLANATALSTAYIVEGTDANGCLDKDTVVIMLVPGAAVVASPGQFSSCKGKTVQLSATGATSYVWSPATNLSAANIASPVATVNGNIQYIVTGRDMKGCISYDTVDVTEIPGPPVDAYADGDGISCYARSIQLHATGALVYQWHPGAYLNDSTIAAPTATPPRTTTFTVTGRDALGCVGTDTLTIASYAEAVVFLPNAFTPNGDHINDDIRPIIFCDFKLDKWEVFNRWGQSVYQGYTLAKGWDGTFNGEPAPLGVYMYYVRGKNDDGQPVIYKGNITLLR